MYGMKFINTKSIITRSHDVMRGAAVFAGTRIPAHSLLDYLAGGHPLEDFLKDFPTVRREQALELMQELNNDACCKQHLI